MSQAQFRDEDFFKASGSGSLGCVEVAFRDGAIGVRDSKNPAGGVLTFNAHEWDVFLDGVRGGEFNRP